MQRVSGWNRVTDTGPSAVTFNLAVGLNLNVSHGGDPPAVFPATQCEAKTSHLEEMMFKARNTSIFRAIGPVV